MMRLGFWKSLWGACCGTAVFDTLREHGWLRTIWHLLILSLLCSIAITIVAAFRMSPEISRAEKLFETQFGGVRLEERGIVPVIEPETGRTVDFSDRLRLIYAPDLAEGVNVAPESFTLLRSCFIWSPKYLGNIVRELDGDTWNISEQTPEKALLSVRRIAGNEALAAYLGTLRDTAGKNWAILKSGEELSSKDLFAVLKVFLLGSYFAWNLIGVFLLPWVFTGIFVGVFRLTGRGFRSMSWGEYWRVGIYAGFPAMLIASFCVAFELPYMEYNTVYMVGLMIYWMVVAARLERSWSGPENGGVQDE